MQYKQKQPCNDVLCVDYKQKQIDIVRMKVYNKYYLDIEAKCVKAYDAKHWI